MDSTPMVSVAIITFNHERYIAQAIESVLMQETNFRFEIVIGEDGSSDKTRNIVENYAKSYPDKIRVMGHRNNLGFGGRINSIETLRSCTGKYISILEGDDFWTDSLKLQKQVEILESDLDFSICFHNSRIIYEDNPGIVQFTNPKDQAEVSNFEDLIHGEFIYTATSMFRRDDFNKFSKKNSKYLNNYTLDLHNAQYGKIKYINEPMSVYRRHQGGMWSMVDREKTLISQLPAYKFYLHYFNRKYKIEFRKHLKKMTAELLAIKMVNEDFDNFWRHYLDYINYNTEKFEDIKHNISIFLNVSKKKFSNTLKRRNK